MTLINSWVLKVSRVVLFALKQRSFQILLLLSLYLSISHIIPLDAHRLLFTLSTAIKDLLVLLLPISITFFIAGSIANFERKAPLFILSLIAFEAFSNGLSVWYAYGWGHFSQDLIPKIAPEIVQDSFSALWKIPFTKPSWWSSDKGTLAGLILGLLAAFGFNKARIIVQHGKTFAEKILTKFFAPLIPIFVLGFVARMHQTQIFHQVIFHYSELLAWLIAILVLYIIFLFSLGSTANSPNFKQRLQNLLPAGLIAFTSGCSLSTMPWTIEGATKNLHNKELAAAIIPATTNIQQIGDCIVNCFLCFVIYTHFHGHTPDISTWGLFSAMFILARFATAAVMGGAIFIMLPVYEKTLQFNPEMIAIILAFNVILDPIVTSANVLANGALCSVFEKVWMKFSQAIAYYKKS